MRTSTRKAKLLIGILLCGYLFSPIALKAQQGSEFWFDVPEINRGHVIVSAAKFLVYLHVTNVENFDVTVTLQLPAEPGFTPITFDVPAQSKRRIQISDPLNAGNRTNAATPLDYFYRAQQLHGPSTGSTWHEVLDCPLTDRPRYIENVLGWSSSDLLNARPYINRTNKGVLMTAADKANPTKKARITSYIEIGVGANMDLISLKAENARGKHFFVPMQDILPNDLAFSSRYIRMRAPAYPSFNITATEDNTKIKIKVPQPIWIMTGPSGLGVAGVDKPAGEYTIWLNRGQSSIICPYEKFTKVVGGRQRPANAYQTTCSEGKPRLGGAEIQVLDDEGSGGDIVVTTREDIVLGPNPDYVADQLVPLPLAGREYAVIPGATVNGYSPAHIRDFVHIVGTEDNTHVEISDWDEVWPTHPYVYNPSPTPATYAFTLNKGQQVTVRMRSNWTEAVAIKADKKVVVFQTTIAAGGNGHTAGQNAGAALPALPEDGSCIGSKAVAFSRTKPAPYGFFLNVLVWDFTPPGWPTANNSGIGHFILQKQSPTGFVNVAPSDPEHIIEQYLNNPANWHTFANATGPAISKWKWLQLNTDAIPILGNAHVQTGPNGDYAYRLINDNNVFHLGILNGHPDNDAFYGYFSDFSQVRIEARVSAVLPGGVVSPIGGTELPLCKGDDVELGVSGGEYMHFTWRADHTPDYLTGHTGPKVKAEGVAEDRVYTVTATGACGIKKESPVRVKVSPPVQFRVAGPGAHCGGAGVPLRLTGLRVGQQLAVYGKPAGTPGPMAEVLPSARLGSSPRPERRIELPAFPEPAGSPQGYTLEVVVRDGACQASRQIPLTLYPRLPRPALSATPAEGCSPLSSALTAAAAGGTWPAGTAVEWRFGDGSVQPTTTPGGAASVSAAAPAVSAPAGSTTAARFTHRVLVADGHGVCRDSAAAEVSALPTPAPRILQGHTARCAPWDETVRAAADGSAGREWTLTGGGLGTPMRLRGSEFTPSAPLAAGHYTLTLRAWLGGCEGTVQQALEVQPGARVKALSAALVDPCAWPATIRAQGTVADAAEYAWSVQESAGGAPQPLEGGSVGSPAATPLALDIPAPHGGDRDAVRYVTLEARTAAGCTARQRVRVRVPAKLQAALAGDRVVGCPARDGSFVAVVRDVSAAPRGSTAAWLQDGAPVAEPGPRLALPLENTSLTAARTVEVARVVTAPGGCTSTARVAVTVYPRVDLALKARRSPGGEPLAPGDPVCAGESVAFEASGAQRYRWEFADGSTAADATPSRALENPDAAPRPWPVRLEGYNDYGCRDAATAVYQVRPALRPAFTVDVVSPCTPMVLDLTSTSRPTGAGYALEWGVDGGREVDPVGHPGRYEFSSPGARRITLRLVDLGSGSAACAAEAPAYEFRVRDAVQARVLPLARAQAYGCAPHTVALEPRVAGADWVEWDFGDGTVSPRLAPGAGRVEHTYANPGPGAQRYTVVARAGRNDQPQCTASSAGHGTVQVTVYPGAIARGSVDVQQPCHPTRVLLGNASANADRFRWDFEPDDPALGTTPPLAPPPGPPAALPQILQNPSEDGYITYTVRLRAAHAWPVVGECRDSLAVGTVRVPPALRPAFTAPPAACSAAEVAFLDRGHGGPRVLHDWDFGDGTRDETTRPGETKRHAFHHPGQAGDRVYPVRVTSRQADVPGGCPVTTALSVRVHPAVRAALEVLPGPRCADPLPVTLRQASRYSLAASGVETRLEWDFGDGTPPEAHTVTNPALLPGAAAHPYPAAHPDDPTPYTARLRVRQAHEATGLTCRDSAVAQVQVLPRVVPTILPGGEIAGCAPLAVALRGEASGGRALRYSWEAGDAGQGAQGPQLAHTYPNRGAAPRVYTAILRVVSEHGCAGEARRDVTVYPGVSPRFALAYDSLCTPFRVRVTPQGAAGAQWEWSRDDGGPAIAPGSAPFELTLDNPEATARAVTIRARAAAAHPGGECAGEYAQTLSVPPRLEVALEASDTAGCQPLEVRFAARARGHSRLAWRFGGVGASDQAAPPPQTFRNDDRAQSRVYPVELVAESAEGCRRARGVRVTVYPRVEAAIGADRTQGCAPLAVALRCAAPSPAYAYRWALGGGHRDTAAAHPGPVVYRAPDPGAVARPVVRLAVSLADHPECRAEAALPLEVYPRPAVDFDPPADACAPLRGTPVNRTRAYPAPVAYTWRLPDGGVYSGAAPALRIDNPSATADRRAALRLVAETARGCRDSADRDLTVWARPRAAFALAGGAMVCPPARVQLVAAAQGQGLRYEYDFGDGSQALRTDDPAGAEHAYDNPGDAPAAYTIAQTVTSPRGCSDRATQALFVYPRVAADFALAPGAEGCSPFAPAFRNASVHADYYRWDFGDGAGSQHAEPAHRFLNATEDDRAYTVTLVARSAYGCRDARSRAVTVWPTPGARFTLTPGVQTFRDPAASVVINNQSSPAADSWSYRWDFGDGQTSRDKHPGAHAYARWGDSAAGFAFPVRLTVENAHCAASAARVAVVAAPAPAPGFSADRDAGCPPLRVQFFNASRYAKRYRWEIDGAPASDSPEPAHTFTAPGVHYVRLVAEGEGGRAHAFRRVEVYPRPEVDFEVAPARVALPGADVRALNRTRYGHAYLWRFGDGAQARGEAPEHAYSQPGVYDVTLVATSAHGCVDSATQRAAVTVSGGGALRFPTAFRPADPPAPGQYSLPDLANQVFHPFIQGAVREYELLVYDRWGERLFRSTDPMVGWNGTRGARLCPQGVYAWRARGVFYDGSTFDLRGNVTLLR